VPPHVYISLCVFSWGVLASIQAVAVSFPTLFIVRVLLGISEAAYGNGIPFYLSFFFRREELALRTGYFIAAAPLATSFASSLAWLITKVGAYGPIAPWRLLFLVEGFPSVIVAVVAWWHIPDTPSTAPWLNSRERKVAVLRLRSANEAKVVEDEKFGLGKRRSRIDFLEIWHTLRDPKSYLTAVRYSTRMR
jgi:phosphatidylinositol 3,5-bisphosphate 5-phosphatase